MPMVVRVYMALIGTMIAKSIDKYLAIVHGLKLGARSTPIHNLFSRKKC